MSAALRTALVETPWYNVLVAPPHVDQAISAAAACRQLRKQGKELHVITRSRVLTDRIRSLIPFGNRRNTMTYTAYTHDMWQAVLRTAPERVDEHNVDLWEFQRRLRSRFVRPLNRRHVVVVNGQQLPTDFYTTLRLLQIDATVFVDPVQSVDDSGTPLDELVSTLGANVPTLPPRSIDSTVQIHELLKNLDDGYLAAEAPDLSGPKPLLVNHNDVDDEISFVVRHAEAHRDARIGVLLPTQDLVRVFKDRIRESFDGTTQWHLSGHRVPSTETITDSDIGVKVLTWASAIGMRFDHIVLAGLDQVSTDARFENTLRVLGPTCRDMLVLSYAGAGLPTVLRNLPADAVDDQTSHMSDDEWVEVAPTVTRPVPQPLSQGTAVRATGDGDAVNAARRVLALPLRQGARRKRLLSAIEEVGLATLMRSAGANLAEELPKGFRSTVSPEDERAQAFDAMVLHNIGLVGRCVIRHQSASLDPDDLSQHGVLGLMRAIEKWDGSRGLKFSTYAINWINQHMGRAIADESTTIRIPVHMYEIVRKVLAGRNRLLAMQDSVSVAEIAAHIALPREQVVRCLRLSAGIISLDAPLGASGDISFAELVPVPFDDESNPDYVIDRDTGAELVRQSVSMLREREAEVLRLRFGFDGGDDRTLEKVGEHFGFTRERARQIESKAKKHLVSKLTLNGLVPGVPEPDPKPSADKPPPPKPRRPSVPRSVPPKTQEPSGDQLAAGRRLAKRLGATAEDSNVGNLLVALVDQALQAGAHRIRVRTAGSSTTTRLAFVHDGTPFAGPTLRSALTEDSAGSRVSAAFGIASSLYNEITTWDAHTSPNCLLLTSTPNAATWSLYSTRRTLPTGLVWDDDGVVSVVLFRSPRPQMAKSRMAPILNRSAHELGVVFGELLGPDINLELDGLNVEAQDPFLWSNTAGQHLGEENVTVDGLSVVVSPRVLPHPDALRTGDTSSVGNPADWSASQGFYVRSGGRYLSCGGWLGLDDLDMASDTALARVLVKVPDDQFATWGEDRPKAHVVPPEPLRPRLIALAQIARNKSRLVFEQHRTGEAK